MESSAMKPSDWSIMSSMLIQPKASPTLYEWAEDQMASWKHLMEARYSTKPKMVVDKADMLYMNKYGINIIKGKEIGEMKCANCNWFLDEGLKSLYSCKQCGATYATCNDGGLYMINAPKEHWEGGDDMGKSVVWGKFWMVLCINSGTTGHRHEDRKDADREAERLCKQEECEVAVLEVVALVQPDSPPVKWSKPE